MSDVQAATGTPFSLADVLTPTDNLGVDDTGVLTVEGCAVTELVERFGSPLYVISEQTLRANYRAVRDAFAARWPADINVLYAIKANNNLAIRAVLHQEGAGGDCFGEGELYATFAGGADPEKLVMNGSNKSYDDLRNAAQLGIRVNIDGEDEIGMLQSIARELGRPVRVNLRIKVLPEALAIPSDYFGTENVTESTAGVQWGLSVETAIQLIRRIQQLDELELQGYHFHLGRGSTSPDFYYGWAKELGGAIARMHRETGFAPAMVDVGGGLARRRDPESRELALNEHTVEEYAEAITSGLLAEFRAAELPIPALWLEPGRYLVGNAVVLLGTVGSVKLDLGRRWIHADFSVNDLMRIETARSRYHVLPASRMNDPLAADADVVGSLCTGNPIGAGLPFPTVQRGDILAVLDAGMYAETASTQLNGVPRPATVLVNGTQAEVVKERETVQDVFARHRVPPRLRVATTA